MKLSPFSITHWERDPRTNRPLFFVDLLIGRAGAEFNFENQVNPHASLLVTMTDIHTSFPEYILNQHPSFHQFFNRKRNELKGQVSRGNLKISPDFVTEIIDFIKDIPEFEKYYLPEFLIKDQLPLIDHPSFEAAGFDIWQEWITEFDLTWEITNLPPEIDRITQLALIFIKKGWNHIQKFDPWLKTILNEFYQSVGKLKLLKDVEIQEDSAADDWSTIEASINSLYQSQLTDEILGFDDQQNLLFIYRPENAGWPARTELIPSL